MTASIEKAPMGLRLYLLKYEVHVYQRYDAMEDRDIIGWFCNATDWDGHRPNCNAEAHRRHLELVRAYEEQGFDGSNYDTASRFHVQASRELSKAEQVAVIEAVAPVLEERGIVVSTDPGDYFATRYAGCVLCACSGGLVYKEAIRAVPEDNPLVVWIDVADKW